MEIIILKPCSFIAVSPLINLIQAGRWIREGNHRPMWNKKILTVLPLNILFLNTIPA